MLVASAVPMTAADPRPMPEPDPGLAVCLGSAFLGFYAHAGFLNALVESGRVPGRISGASAGAIVAGLHGAGVRGAELRETVLDPGLKRSFLDWRGIFRLPGVVSGCWSTGIFSASRAMRRLDGLVGGARMEDLKSPEVEIAVANAGTRRTELLRTGDLASVIVASCAVPGLFQPQRIEGQVYLDGGIAVEAPFTHWLENPEIHTIIVHRVRSQPPRWPQLPWPTVGNVISATRGIIREEFHRHRDERARISGTTVMDFQTLTPSPGLLHERGAAACYAAGEKTAREGFA